MWSAYVGKRSKFDTKPYACGINSIQLLYDEYRWWVISIYYSKETIHKPIPKKYLKKYETFYFMMFFYPKNHLMLFLVYQGQTKMDKVTKFR